MLFWVALEGFLAVMLCFLSTSVQNIRDVPRKFNYVSGSGPDFPIRTDILKNASLGGGRIASYTGVHCCR